jgi:hypothetical protein
MRLVALATLLTTACASPEGDNGTGTGGSNGTGTAGTHGGTAGSGSGSAGTGSGTAGTQGTGGSSTQGTGGSSAQGTGGSNPQGTGGSSPQGTGGSNPQGTGGSNPQGTGGSNPQGTGGSSAPGAGGMGGMTGTGGSAVGGRGGNGGAGGMGGAAGRGGTTGMAGRGGTTGTAGMTGTAGAMGSGGTGGGTPSPSKEDEGADCAVPTIPAANTAIAKLPDPFKKIDGTMVMSKADWRCRREEIKKLEEKYVYGPKPPPPQSVTGTVSTSSISVMVMDNGKSASFTATVSIPSGAAQPVPAIISYGGLAGIDMAWLTAEGVAFINFNPTSVGAEGHGHGTSQTGAFYTLYSGGSATGLLTAWGWGVSRIIDVIEKSGSTIIKPDAIGVTGCSRYGKGAFIAGVLDQRVALTLPVESGTAGVPIWRGIAKAEKGENGNPSQSLSSAYSEQPWFGDPFQPFLSNPANNPIDTHELVAMIAPRGAFIMDNPHIGELSPKYGHVAALAGAEVYKALGAADAIGYNSNVQSGTHCSVRPEWQAPFKAAVERFLKKTGTAAQTINAFSSQSGNLSDWRDWTTPTLP